MALLWSVNNGLLAALSHPTGRIALVASHCPPENQSYLCESNSVERLPLETRQRVYSLCILSFQQNPKNLHEIGPWKLWGREGTLLDVGVF